MASTPVLAATTAAAMVALLGCGGPTSDHRRTLAGRGVWPRQPRATRLRRGGPARRMPRRPAPAARPVRQGAGACRWTIAFIVYVGRGTGTGSQVRGMSSSSTSGRWAAREPAQGTPAPARRRWPPPRSRRPGCRPRPSRRATRSASAPGRGVSRLRDQGLGVPCTSARHRVRAEDSVGATRLTGPWLRTDAVWTVDPGARTLGPLATAGLPARGPLRLRAATHRTRAPRRGRRRAPQRRAPHGAERCQDDGGQEGHHDTEEGEPPRAPGVAWAGSRSAGAAEAAGVEPADEPGAESVADEVTPAAADESARLTRTWGRAARAGLTAYEVGWGSERSGAVRASGARARASTRRSGPRTAIASCSRRRTQCWRNRQPRSQ